MFYLLNKLKIVSAAIVLSFILSACGGSAPIDKAALNKPLAEKSGRLQIVRTDEFAASLSGARLKIDDREVANLDNGGWKIVDVPAGKHKLTVDHWGHVNVYNLNLNVKPGMLYTLEVSPREEAVVAGAIFGLAGTLIEAAANENGGSFQIKLVKERPIRS